MQPKAKNILVTGHKGFIGSNLWPYLRSDENFVATGFDLPNNNVVSLDEVMFAMQDKDCVVHLAGEPGIGDSIMDPHGNFRTNVVGTMNVIRAARECRSERVVFASSAAADDSSSPYGASKATAEAYLRAFHQSYGMGSVILRFANVYGKHCMHKKIVTTEFIKSAIIGDEIVIRGDGSAIRDYIYAEDIADAIMKACETDIGKIAGKTIDIGTGRGVSINELIEVIKEIHGGPIHVRREQDIPGFLKVHKSETLNAEELLGFTAKTSLEDGIKETYDWIKKEIGRREKFYHI